MATTSRAPWSPRRPTPGTRPRGQPTAPRASGRRSSPGPASRTGPTPAAAPGDWRVNCAVGFEILADAIIRLGLRGGFKAYNGGDAYATDAMARYAVWDAALSTAKPKGENMLENYRVTGNGTLRLICPVGSASAITEKAWLSAAADGPDAATVRWFAQSDTTGISDGTWTIGVHNGRSDRPVVELPDGTTQISVLYQFDQDGVIALETQSK